MATLQVFHLYQDTFVEDSLPMLKLSTSPNKERKQLYIWQRNVWFDRFPEQVASFHFHHCSVEIYGNH